MGAPNPDRFPRRRSTFRNLRMQLSAAMHPPHIGVTQGGSSRKWRGAKVAATDGLHKPEKEKRNG